MNKFEQKHEELKKQLAMIGIFDSDAETREIKVTPLYNTAKNRGAKVDGNLMSIELNSK